MRKDLKFQEESSSLPQVRVVLECEWFQSTSGTCCWWGMCFARVKLSVFKRLSHKLSSKPRVSKYLCHLLADVPPSAETWSQLKANCQLGSHRESPSFHQKKMTTFESLRAPVWGRGNDTATCKACVTHHVIVDSTISTIQLGDQEIQEENLSSANLSAQKSLRDGA